MLNLSAVTNFALIECDEYNSSHVYCWEPEGAIARHAVLRVWAKGLGSGS